MKYNMTLAIPQATGFHSGPEHRNQLLDLGCQTPDVKTSNQSIFIFSFNSQSNC